MLWIVLVMRLFRLTDRENSTPSPRQAAITFFVPNAEPPRGMIVASGSVALAVGVAWWSWGSGAAPARKRSGWSMQSAPHIMPAMIVVSFPAGLTAPDRTRVLGRSTWSRINRERPVCSASSITGTRPAADTRFRSSKTADPTANVCDDCTGNAFRNADNYDFDNRYCPSSGGIFAVHTPIIAGRPSTDSGLVMRGLDRTGPVDAI